MPKINKTPLNVFIDCDRKTPSCEDRFRDIFSESGYRIVFDRNALEEIPNLAILFENNPKKARKKISRLRNDERLALVPAVFFGLDHLEIEKGSFDYVVNEAVENRVFLSKIDRLMRISRETRKLPPSAPGQSGNNRALIRFFRYLLTRGNPEVLPKRAVESPVGYSYPLLKDFLRLADAEITAVLENRHQDGFLQAELVDRVNICPECRRYELNFQETCPHCRSIDIANETTMHHYQCAFVGREQEFLRGGTMVCPKCNLELRHIGVDYDTSRKDLFCFDCGRIFPEPLLRAKCISCGKLSPPEELQSASIRKYRLSEKGIRAAMEGTLREEDRIVDLIDPIGFYRKDIFLILFELEVKRVRRYRFQTCLAFIDFAGLLNALEDNSGALPEESRKEIRRLFRETFRRTDVVCEIRPERFLVLLLNTSPSQVEIGLGRFKKTLESLTDKSIRVPFRVFDLSEDRFASFGRLLEIIESGENGIRYV